MPARIMTCNGHVRTAAANSDGRLVRYVFSTPEVARDRHTIAAWDLGNFSQNPVFLWAHEADKPPIGKIVDLADNRGTLTGTVQYATAEEYDFAETIFRLVRGGYINAVSVSWNPLEWEWSKDRSRPGGIDFKLAELLEVSQVPVPALPGALATARSAGIDLAPLRAWAENILDDGKTLIVPRDQIEALWKEAKMSDSDVIDWTKLKGRSATPARNDVDMDALRRDLYGISEGAYLLSMCQKLASICAAEAQEEGDGSPLPGEIAGIAKQIGEWLKKYVVEEVDETNEEADEGDDDLGDVLGRLHSRSGKVLSGASEKALRLCHTHFAQGCDMLSRFIDEAMGVDDNPAVQGTDPDDVLEVAQQADKARAARERRAKALKLKIGLVA